MEREEYLNAVNSANEARIASVVAAASAKAESMVAAAAAFEVALVQSKAVSDDAMNALYAKYEESEKAKREKEIVLYEVAVVAEVATEKKAK